MPYRDISLVSIIGLRGTLYVQKIEDADGVSVQTEGPYEAKVVDEAWLMIYPEGQEPQSPHLSHTDITFGQTHVGSVDVTARMHFLAGSRPRTRTVRMRARTPVRAQVRAQAAVHITAPPKTRFELISCHGKRKGPRGWHIMRGNDRFTTR